MRYQRSSENIPTLTPLVGAGIGDDDFAAVGEGDGFEAAVKRLVIKFGPALRNRKLIDTGTSGYVCIPGHQRIGNVVDHDLPLV